MAEEQKQLLEQIEQLIIDGTPLESGALKELLNEKRSSDIAEVVELLDNEQRRAVFDALEKPISAEVLEKVDEATRAELFELLEDEELADLISELDADDAADVLAELPEEESEEVVDHTFRQVILLIFIWLFAYVAARLMYQYLSKRLFESGAPRGATSG